MAAGKEVGRLSIKVTPDLDGFYRELKTAVESAEKMKIHIPVEPDMGNFRQEVAASTAGMSTRVKVQADVDRGLLDRLSSSLGNLKAPSFGSGINPSGYLLILGAAASLTPLIAGTLGAISSALLTLPGLVTAVAVPIGALALGIDGLKRAAERLKPAFDGLKESMSTAVENQFGPVFDQLGKAIPTLAANLPKVTQGMADVAKSIADSITSGEGLSRIESLISNIGAAISRSAPGLTAFVDGLLNLAEKFSGKLPAIADWINRTGDSFSKWVDSFTRIGPDGVSKFDNAMSGLGDTLQMLGGGLVDILGKSLDFFSDPEKIKAFKAELDGLIASLSTIVDLVNRLGAAFSKVPGLSDGQANGIMDFAPIQIQAAIELIKKIPTAWEGVKLKAAEVWNSIPQIAASALSSLSSVISNVVSAASGAWDGLVGAASAAFSSVIASAQSVISGVTSAFVSAGAQVLAEVGSWPGRIVGALGDLAGQLGSIGASAGAALISGLASAITGGISRVVGAVGSMMGSIKALIPNSPAETGPFSGSGWKQVTGFGDALGDGLASGISAQEGRIVGLVTQIMQSVKDVFGDASGLNLTFNFGAMQTGLSGLQSSLDTVTSSSQSLNKSLAATASDLASGSSLMNSDTKNQLNDLKQTYDELELRRKELQVAKNEAGSKDEKAAIQDQMDRIKAEKDRIALERDKLKLLQQQSGEMGEQKTLAQFLGEQIASSWQQGTDAVAGFARSNLDQAMSDLGIGGGAITNGLNAGLDWGTQALGNVMNIQVNSVDDAIAVKNNEISKQALTYTRR
ncbi:hypothetical protein [Mycolicibacterium smegmatis]|uniref:Tape measure protein n=1 Tax=Mycolicibacterium smegmatis (strain MKD8) TaxID=1214915 RepID=A0A2U9PLM4_MYCSE|nr:hypothetical protein [Mycolicibacterium smegmatis]AWT52588.1 hypothetical protein D806_016040 [Mycolicibacterium smegmatis MKD8]